MQHADITEYLPLDGLTSMDWMRMAPPLRVAPGAGGA